MKVVGVDPSQRHTGLCLMDETLSTVPVFYEIQTRGSDLLTSIQKIRKEFTNWLDENTELDDVVFSMEKMPSGARGHQVLLPVQLALFEVVQSRYLLQQPLLVNPLPVQLKSYMWHRFKIKSQTANKSEIVKAFRDQFGNAYGVGRISSHCVEAFFLTKMAVEVLQHTWSYNKPEKELRLHPWEVLYGATYK